MVPASSPCATAASFVPSDDEVIADQSLVDPTDVSSVKVAPESADLQMLPPLTAATSFVPSDDEVIEYHLLVDPTDVSSVHVAPRRPDLRRWP